MNTPLFIIDENRVENNCKILASIKERTGCKILLALKGFACWPLFSMISTYLDGTCASSLWEARLGREMFDGEVHCFAAAYSDDSFKDLLPLCDEIDFNSFSQWEHFKRYCSTQDQQSLPKFGLRINPECSTQPKEHALYDPCAAGSRLGIRHKAFKGLSLEGISGLHFHTLCEQNANALQTTLHAFEGEFGDLISRMEWVNFGGGHHITRENYDRDLLCELINDFKRNYGVDVILEPGEAVVLNAGVLVSTVLDIIDNEGMIAILDISCTCHMPDVLEMPYRPAVAKVNGDYFESLTNDSAGEAEQRVYSYQLTGCSCLAGDVIGKYSFDEPLQVGDQLVFGDMAHYSMVKTSFFNGIQHPAIAIQHDGELDIIRTFSYADYKRRLA